jgi:hypothetical protein
MPATTNNSTTYSTPHERLPHPCIHLLSAISFSLFIPGSASKRCVSYTSYPTHRDTYNDKRYSINHSGSYTITSTYKRMEIAPRTLTIRRGNALAILPLRFPAGAAATAAITYCERKGFFSPHTKTGLRGRGGNHHTAYKWQQTSQRTAFWHRLDASG